MKHKIVKIEWFDASSLTKETKEWLTKEEAIEVAEEKYQDTCITAGIILKENKNYIVIAGTYAYEVYSDLTVIPKGMIKKVITLTKTK